MINRLHDLALTIAPELRDRPLYVLDTAQLVESELPVTPDAFGFAIQTHRMLAPIAEIIDGYNGGGQVICIDFAAIEAAANPGFEEHVLNGVLIHEVAHCVPAKPIGEQTEDQVVRNFEASMLPAWFSTPQPEPGAEGDFHGPEFIRYCCHLYSRAQAAGFAATIDDVLGYDLLSLKFYLPLVVGECLTMRDATFAEIQAEPMPEGLEEFWRSDIEYQNKMRLCHGSN